MLERPQGDNGNPIDALFVPDGFNKSIAAMSQNEYIELWANDRFKQLSDYLNKLK